MAKTTKPAASLRAEIYDAEIRAVAATLPADRAELLEAARSSMLAYNDAGVAGDQEAAAKVGLYRDAIAWTLNGGTFSGYIDSHNPEAGGIVMERHCAAEPGQIPMWGQGGDFVLTVDGMRVRVNFGQGPGRSSAGGMSLHAVDLDKPFLSSTGFRSCLSDLAFRGTVKEAVTVVIRRLIEENGRQPISPSSRDFLKSQPRPAWIEEGDAFCQDAGGQMAFAF